GNDPTYGHRTFTLDAPGLAAAATATGTLAVNLQGATASGFTDEHQAQVSLNGTPLGQTSWTGIAPRQAVFSVPAGPLLATANRAAYVVIAPASMRDAAERLADTRRAQGMAAIVADLDQIMDTFNGGVSDPRAIRTFLSYAHTHWSQGPRYVALAGAGT